MWRNRADLASFLLRVSVQNGSVERNLDLSLRGPPKFRAQCRSHFFQTGQNPQGTFRTIHRLNPAFFQCFRHSKKKKDSRSLSVLVKMKKQGSRSLSSHPGFKLFRTGQNGLISVPVIMQREVPDSLPDRFLLCTNVLFSG